MAGIPYRKKAISLVAISTPGDLKTYPTGTYCVPADGQGAFLLSDSTVPTEFSWSSGSNGSIAYDKTTGATNITTLTASQAYVSGGLTVGNYVQLLPVGNIAIPTNQTASYIYTSGSTNDLYFTQYFPGTSYTNTTRLRWLESGLETGLLNGGRLSTVNETTTFNIASGSGIVVSMNASLSRDPYPTIQYVQWGNFVSQSLPLIGTTQITYIALNSSGSIVKSSIPFADGDFNNYIVLGRILHQTGSVTNGAVTAPVVAYGSVQNKIDFFRAFGPLKISGHILAASGSTLGLTKTSGDSFAIGRNYTTDPNNPNYISSTTDTALTTSKIYREYVSGSTLILDTGIANAGYTTIDPTKRIDTTTGLLTSVPAGKYTTQRVFWFPNSINRALHIYYGNTQYNSLDEAQAGAATDNFVEDRYTSTEAIFVAYICVKSNATDLSNTSDARIIQAGFARGIGGPGGGGSSGGTGGSPTGPAGGDLDGTYPDPTLAVITTASTSGSATAVPVVTIDAKGRVTGMTSTSIQIAESQVTNLTTDLSTINTSISSLDTSVTTLNTNYNSLSSSYYPLSSSFVSLSSSYYPFSSSVDSNLTSINTSISSINTSITTLNTNYNSLSSSYYPLSSSFVSLSSSYYPLSSSFVIVSSSVADKVSKTGDTMTGGLTISYGEVVQYLNSTDTTLGSYLILRSNGTNIGSFQAGGTSMASPFGDQMRIRAYRAAGGIDFAVAGSNDATTRMDASRNLMVSGSAWFGKTVATTYSDTFGRVEVYYPAATGGVKCGVAAIDTTTQAAGQGGGITFGGSYTGTTVTTAGVIRASKTNSTDGNFSFGMDFYTRVNGAGSLNKSLSITDAGNTGIGVAVPTAVLNLKAGTTAASSAPLKFTSGSLLTSPEAGAVEFNGDNLYLTITSSTARKNVTLDDGLTFGQIPFTTGSGRLAGSSALTYTASNSTLNMSFAQNARTAMVVTNNSSLSAAEAGFSATTNVGTFFFGAAPNASSNAGGMIHTSVAAPFRIFTNNALRILIRGTDGEIGLGVTAPTAVLHLKAGTSTAGTAPLKFTSGPLMSTAEAGVVEFLTDKYYASITTGPARKEITLNDGALSTNLVTYTTTNGRLTGSTRLGYDGTALTQFAGTYTIVPTASAAAAITVSGSNTVGGSSYVDFIKVTNTSAGALTPNKTFRLDNSGSIQVINSAYTQNILSLENNGHMNIYGGASATAVSESATSGSLRFGSNNTGYSEIYHDGNFHIHSKALAPMWINTNFSTLNLLTQAPGAGTSKGTGVVMGGDGSQIGFLTVSGSTSYTTAASYGYLVNNSMTPSGYYAGGSQTINVSIYAKDRILGQEIDALSDERMKDIQGEIPAEDAVRLVNNLKPIKYTWKDSEDKGLKTGFSAQQVIKSGFGHLVSAIPKQGMEEIIEEDGFVNPKDTQFVMNYDQVVPYHNSVIKLLLDKIEKLEQTVAELQNKLEK